MVPIGKARFFVLPCAMAVLTTVAVGSVPTSVVQGTYQVPVSAAGSEGNAHFQVKDLNFSGENGARHISFQLPDDLCGGKPTKVELKEVATTPQGAFVAFSGDTSAESASCALEGKTAICLIHYRAQSASAAEIERFLTGKYKNAAAVKQKLAVALAYQNEPAGVLSFDLNIKKQ